MTIAEWVSVFLAAAALFTAWQSGRRVKSQNKGDEALAVSNITDAAIDLLQPLKDRIGELAKLTEQQQETIDAQGAQIAALEAARRIQDGRITELEAKYSRWRTFALALVARLRELGHEPPSAAPPD